MLNPLKRTAANNLSKMMFIRLFYWMHFISAVLIPFFRDWGGLGFTKILILNAWFMICVFLLEIPTGTVADRFGRKVSLVLACPIAIAAVLIYTIVPNFWLFMVGELIMAASFTLMSGADEALVYDSLEELGKADESKRVYARLESFKLAGILLGALLGGAIAKYISLTAPLRLQAIPLAMCFVVALLLKEPATTARASGKRSYRRILVDGARYFISHRTLRVLAFDMVGINAVCWVIIWFYQALVERAGLDILYFGAVHAGMTVGQITILSNIERIERAFGSKRRVLILGALVPGVAYLALGMTSSLWIVIVSIMFVANLGLARGPLFISYMNKHIPSDMRATVLSTASMFRMLAIAIVNPICGALADWSLSRTMFILGASAILLALASRVKEEHLID